MMKQPVSVVPIVLVVSLLAAVAYAQDGPVRIDVKEDVQVRSSDPDGNYSKSRELYAGSYRDWIYRSYLKFDLSALPQGAAVEKASLFAVNRFGSTAPPISVYSAGNGWVDVEITWNNAPPVGDEPCDTVVLAEKGTEYEWDVKDALAGATGPGGVVTLVLGDTPGAADAWSRLIGKDEDPARGPYLMVECGAATKDVTPPTIVLETIKDTLWPPSHKMVLCAVLKEVSDEVDPDPDVAIEVTSNEAINGKGDGNTDYDWEVKENPDSGAQEVWLRAERSGGGDGREYKVSVVATDEAGNAATEVANITVKTPHNQGKKTKGG